MSLQKVAELKQIGDKNILTVDIVSDVICPWCFVGKRWLERAIKALPGGKKVLVRWLPFQLNPKMPLAGMNRREYRTTDGPDGELLRAAKRPTDRRTFISSSRRRWKKEYPFGADAIGYIYYSDTGIMAVQISRRSRDTTKDLEHLHHEYLCYFGLYEIDLERSVIRHFLEGQLFPGDHPELLERRYHFVGELISLKPLDGTNREILWERVASSVL